MPVAGSPFVRTRELTDLIALSSVASRDDESMSNIITICYALTFGLMPAHAQLGNLVKTVKSKAEKVVKEVSDDVKNQLDRTPSQAKGAVAQAQK